MSFHVIIPARLKSTRLPNKPLADINGLPMIVRVAQRAALSQAISVTVAADDLSIIQACEQYNIQAVLTDVRHLSGSDRLAQASQCLNLQANDIVVNVQGDEPLIPAGLINACANALQMHSECAISTAAHSIENQADYSNPNVVKVVCDAQGHALYFSRAPIPWWRDGNLALQTGEKPNLPPKSGALQPLRHIGIYAYRVGFLERFPTLPVSPLEQLESLEQLRAMWHGERIAVYLSSEKPGPGVDTAEDLERVRKNFANT